MTDRPGWPAYFLGIARAVAARGDCRRSLVGAVLVDANHTVISQGYNGTLPGLPGCREGYCPRGQQTYDDQPAGGDYAGCIGVHAEANALRFALQAGQQERVKGSTCYITRAPCVGCAALLTSAGVVEQIYPGVEFDVVHSEDETNTSAANPSRCIDDYGHWPVAGVCLLCGARDRGDGDNFLVPRAETDPEGS